LEAGADGETRTRDLPLTRRLLCRLSYVGGEAVAYHRGVPAPAVERLRDEELDLVRPLLIELELEEQPHFEHPQLSRGELERLTPPIRPSFAGENVCLAVREGPALAAFCWCVLFDPGTGLEGEVAEVYVAPDHRGRGLATRLLREAVRLFQERGVTLAYVWTRAQNESATRLYRGAGFTPAQQLVMTWYPKP
jgi:ribosomal protein S18 acetylase RimI-like enzyme